MGLQQGRHQRVGRLAGQLRIGQQARQRAGRATVGHFAEGIDQFRKGVLVGRRRAKLPEGLDPPLPRQPGQHLGGVPQEFDVGADGLGEDRQGLGGLSQRDQGQRRRHPFLGRIGGEHRFQGRNQLGRPLGAMLSGIALLQPLIVPGLFFFGRFGVGGLLLAAAGWRDFGPRRFLDRCASFGRIARAGRPGKKPRGLNHEVGERV